MVRSFDMKVLFLDVDGVLNHEGTFKKDPQAYFPIDPYCAFLVGKIQLDSRCHVVLSSSWRGHEESTKYIHNRVVPLFGKTERLGVIRGEEIKDWLERHPEVTKYAILDDDNDMLPEQMPNFFQTSFHKEGLTDEIASKVIVHLNGYNEERRGVSWK